MFVSSTLMRSTFFPAAALLLSRWFHHRHPKSTWVPETKKTRVRGLISGASFQAQKTGHILYTTLLNGTKNWPIFRAQKWNQKTVAKYGKKLV